ncbi:MAG TPA: DNA replication and repair protein RecF [Opitutaceae bacterium]|nr:DNA replication and repair protein RecF [Opitutaceae bacterium]
MVIRHIAVQGFRNIALATMDLAGGCAAFVGANGQGKTNLLEAVGFVTALRSFRQPDARLLIGHGMPEAGIFLRLEHEKSGPTDVTIRLRPGGKEIVVDGAGVTRLGDFLGKFPTVTFCFQDIQLIRGSPSARRRFLDLVLAAMDSNYLDALQRYHKALAGRNALLKSAAGSSEIAAFEHPLSDAAVRLIAGRESGVAILSRMLADAYRVIVPEGETPEFAYEADAVETDAGVYAGALAGLREQDRIMRNTQRGPHRDDFSLRIDGRSARDFGSEGQQRSLVLALRLAQLAYFYERSGVRPVALADDVLGELDPGRRRRFWSALDSCQQVLATGTLVPDVPAHGGWQVFTVEHGDFIPSTA